MLDLAVSSDESKVFASGVDSRVVCIQRQLDAENQVWMLSQAQRPHTHDVKSLEICRKKPRKTAQGDSAGIDLLITGGVDTKICTYNVTQYHQQRPRVIYPWPTISPVFVSPGARITGIIREDKVELYQLNERENVSDPVQVPEENMAIGTVEIRHASNLSDAAMSNDGRYLGVTTMTSFYLFSLTFDRKQRLQTKQLSLAKEIKCPISAMKFVNDSTLVLSCVDGSFVRVSLDNKESEQS